MDLGTDISHVGAVFAKNTWETIKFSEPIAEGNLVPRLFNYSEYLFNYTDYHSNVK